MYLQLRGEVVHRMQQIRTTTSAGTYRSEFATNHDATLSRSLLVHFFITPPYCVNNSHDILPPHADRVFDPFMRLSFVPFLRDLDVSGFGTCPETGDSSGTRQSNKLPLPWRSRCEKWSECLCPRPSSIEGHLGQLHSDERFYPTSPIAVSCRNLPEAA